MLKTLWGGKEPTKGSKYSAAIDLYAQDDFIMEVGETRIIPLGICIDEGKLKPKHFFKQYRDYNPDLIDSMIEIDEDRYDKFMKSHYLQLEPRSSIRAKGIISCSGIIDIDYKVFAQNGKNPTEGRSTIVCMITEFCMECLITRKERWV